MKLGSRGVRESFSFESFSYLISECADIKFA